MNGIIIVDKPAGWTSHDVIAKLRGALKIKRIGHGGTLDPMATGVLPVFIGRATRAAEFCENAEKEYIAELKLGIVTDTQDITGTILSKNEVTATLKDLIDVLPDFTGALKQTPPMYSAIKKDGKKLYELARRGIDIPREARDIYISSLEVVSNELHSKTCKNLSKVGNQENNNSQPPDTYTLRIACSKGTYIRTVCHDIGAALGSGGTLTALRRTRAGVYSIEMAHTLEDVLKNVLTDSVSNIIQPVDSIFSDYSALSLSESEVRRAKNGAECQVKEKITNGKYRVYAPDGEFLLLGEVNNNVIKTIKSFFEV